MCVLALNRVGTGDSLTVRDKLADTQSTFIVVGRNKDGFQILNTNRYCYLLLNSVIFLKSIL